MQSLHAVARLDGRLADANININNLEGQVEAIAATCPSIAVCVLRFPNVKNRSGFPCDCRKTSNGDQLWAICRDGVVVTWMFRRSDQPATATALRVERLARL